MVESRKPKQKIEPGPEVPVDGTEVGVSYIAFEDIQDYQGDLDVASLHAQIRESSKSEDWKQQYDAVN